MKIFITGGSGYVGQHLAQKLSENSSEIILLDLYPPRKFQKLKLKNVIRFEKADVTNENELLKVFEKHPGIDVVIHVAGIGLAGTANLPAFDHKTKTVNFDGTQNVINACLLNNIQALGNSF
jgi:nucleoside-diphosphate-sugar epimerase